jgi:putative phosphoesterase
MKILIVSDSHGRYANLDSVIEKVQPIDLLIHLGDFEGGSDYIEAIAPCKIEMISGNNDYFTSLSREKLITVGNYKVFLTHGHYYGVNNSTEKLKEKARELGADIAMYGHTHIPLIDLTKDVWTINPGSISLPRQAGNKPSFIIMDIDYNGKAHFTINYLK